MRHSTRAWMPASFSFSRMMALDLGQELLARLAPRLDRVVHLLVGDGIDVAEGQVFQFAADLAHAEAVGDGGVDFQGLAGDGLPAFFRQVLQGAHVVQAVGQLDEDHANVVHHGQHHLAQVLGLALFAGVEIDLADLGDALDDVRHLVAEFLFDLLDGDGGVFDQVVQQAGGDGDGVQLHLRQHAGDFQRDAPGRARRRRGSARCDSAGKSRRPS